MPIKQGYLSFQHTKRRWERGKQAFVNISISSVNISTWDGVILVQTQWFPFLGVQGSLEEQARDCKVWLSDIKLGHRGRQGPRVASSMGKGGDRDPREWPGCGLRLHGPAVSCSSSGLPGSLCPLSIRGITTPSLACPGSLPWLCGVTPQWELGQCWMWERQPSKRFSTRAPEWGSSPDSCPSTSQMSSWPGAGLCIPLRCSSLGW